MNSLRNKVLWLLILISVAVSCTKEKDYIYEINPSNVEQQGSNKNTLKSPDQFISIAWQDLFGTNIPQNEMAKMTTVATAFGDKKVVEDLIIRNFLNKPGLQLPSSPSVNGDTAAFIKQVYMKFYNREASVFEEHYLKEQFRLNTSLKPEGLYYALMTSDEYRFY